MAEKNGNLHIHHRQRLKNRFLNEGLEGFEPHNVLELLLFFGIPQGDTNDIAHELINKFGSVAGVLDAQYDDLTRIKGVGSHTATLIKLVQEIFYVYYRDKNNRDSLAPYTVEDAARRLVPLYMTERVEIVRALFFDNKMALVDEKVVFEGGVNSARLPFQSIVQLALNRCAPNIIIAHNHPDGSPVPSPEDIDTTKRMKQVFGDLGINIVEHLVIAGGRYSRISEFLDAEKIPTIDTGLKYDK